MSRHLLPAQPTAIIGRDTELADVTRRLAEARCRLLTIVGPGGVGKTRLAIEAAAQSASRFADGVFFVDLQPVEADSLTSALADAVGLSLGGQEAPRDQLAQYLREKAMLLVLDNFEHLLSRATLLGELLAEAPATKLLVTSREALNLQQEWIYPLRGLPVPPGPDVEALSSYGAVQLFRERARRVKPDFALEAERQAVVRICRLVEGLPLALELAASWTRTLACSEIADEIERNLGFLTTPLRDVPARHRSMQAVFDQMWRLLGEEERRVFRRLSVFRGGFGRTAAEAAAGASLNVLSALVDKCMIRRDGRYQVHELLRQFGEEKLEAAPAEAEAARRQHVDYYSGFLHRRVEAIQTEAQRQAAREIAAEWDNVRAAWRRAVAAGDIAAIDRAAPTLHYFCQLRSRFLEGATVLEAASSRLEEAPATRERDLVLAHLFNGEGWLRIRTGAFDRAEQILEESCRLYQKHDAVPPPHMGADSAIPLATIVLIQGDAARAIALCESAREGAAARNDKQNLAFAHYGLASAQAAQGNYAAADRHAALACKVAREAGNRWFLAYPLIAWGNVASAMGKEREAEQHYRAAYALKEAFEDPEGMAVTLRHLGDIAVQQGRVAEAAQLFRRSLELYRDLNDRGGLATCLRGLGQVALAGRQVAPAAGYLRRALRIAAEIRYWPLVGEILLDVAALFTAFERPDAAISLLTLVQNHPSSTHQTRERAQRRLESCGSEMADADVAGAVQQGASWDIERALVKVDSELAAAAETDSAEGAEKQPLVEPLTDRELDVLRLMVQGQTNAEIAEELVLALGTVKWYASQIYGKLGVANRTEAAALARRLDLVSA